MAVPPTAAVSFEKPQILVLQVQAEQALGRGSAKVLGELLLADVHASGRYRAIGATDLVALLEVEQQRQLVDCEAEAACLTELGAAFGAGMVLEASVGAIGAQRVLILKLIDTQKVSVVARAVETVADDDALIPALHRLTSNVLNAGPGAPSMTVPTSEQAGIRGGWWVAGGGGLLLAGGAVFGGLAAHDLSALRSNPGDDGLGQSADLKAAVADGLFVAGGVLLSAGILWLLFGGGG